MQQKYDCPEISCYHGHRCMNEYNSSPQYVKGGNINYWLKLNAAICVFVPEEKKTSLQVVIFQIITSAIQS